MEQQEEEMHDLERTIEDNSNLRDTMKFYKEKYTEKINHSEIAQIKRLQHEKQE